MAVSQSGTYSLLGINQAAIPTMQEQIRKYKSGIEDPLTQLSASVDYAAGFKGSSIADSLRAYLEKVIAEILKMTAYIEDFDRSLETVSANYVGQAEAVSNMVSADVDSVQGKEIQTGTGVSGFGAGTGAAAGTGAGGPSTPAAQTLR